MIKRILKVIVNATKLLISTLEINQNTLTPIVAFLLAKKMKTLIEKCKNLGKDKNYGLKSYIESLS